MLTELSVAQIGVNGPYSREARMLTEVFVAQIDRCERTLSREGVLWLRLVGVNGPYAGAGRMLTELFVA